MQGLDEQRRLEALAARPHPAQRDHVGGGVAAVDVDAAWSQGTSSRPVPQPASSTGCACSTCRLKYSISGPSVLKFAHHSATSPWCHVCVVSTLSLAMISAMGEQGYTTATIAALALPDGWSPIRRTLGIEAFGVNAWTAHEAGAVVIQEHDESSGHEELYVVVVGTRPSRSKATSWTRPAGTLVFVRDPKAKRGAVATEPGTTVLVVGVKPGERSIPCRGR